MLIDRQKFKRNRAYFLVGIEIGAVLFVMAYFFILYKIEIPRDREVQQAYINECAKNRALYILYTYYSKYDIMSDGNIEDEYLKRADALFELMPENVRNNIKRNDIAIALVDDLVEQNLIDMYADNKKSKYVQEAYTENYSRVATVRVDKEAIETSFLHEIGHAIDGTYYATGRMYTPSMSPKFFFGCYLKEVDSFCDSGLGNTPEHYKENSKEYFAECFQQYFYSPHNLKEAAPNTYEYMKELTKKMR